MITTDLTETPGTPVDLLYPPGSRVIGRQRIGTVLGTGRLRGADVVYVAWDARGSEPRAHPDTVIPHGLAPIRGVRWG